MIFGIPLGLKGILFHKVEGNEGQGEKHNTIEAKQKLITDFHTNSSDIKMAVILGGGCVGKVVTGSLFVPDVCRQICLWPVAACR